jgi:PAS domain S-box-containing protein
MTKRAVVIEDSRTQAAGLAGLLRRAGFDVRVAYDGLAGVEACTSAPPDVVVSDVLMPKMDGYDVCRALRRDPRTKDVPVLLLTGSTEPSAVLRALEAGATNFCSKSVDGPKLLARVERLVAEREREGGQPAAAREVRVDAPAERLVRVLYTALEDAAAREEELRVTQADLKRAIDGEREARAAAQASEARYRFLSDVMPQLVWSTSASGRLEYVNQRLSDFAGARLEAVWAAFEDALVYPDDREAFRGKLRASFASSSVFELECRLCSGEGEVRWFLVRGEPMRDGAGGNVVRWIFTSTDIDGRKRAERERQAALEELEVQRRRLETVLEQIPSGIVLADAATQAVDFANAHAATIVRGDVPRGPLAAFARHLPTYEGANGEPLPVDALPLVRALRGEALHNREYAIDRLDGTRAYVSVNAGPIVDGRGAVMAAVAAFTDRTELRAAEEERKRHDQFRDLFLGILAHDLRNPLNTIVMGAELVKELLEPGGTEARTLDRIGASARRMARMIEQLLDMTRVRLGKGLVLQPEPTEMGELCERMVEEARLAHPARAFELERRGECHAVVDRDRVEQVLSNLLGNAVAHGAAALPVRMRVSGGGGSVQVAVHNAGEPIPPDVLPRLFDPFVQGRLKRNSEGLGLGLFICHQVASAHGGTLAVESSPERGTTFTLTLPQRAEGAKIE